MSYITVDDLFNLFVCPEREIQPLEYSYSFDTNFEIYTYINKEILKYALGIFTATSSIRYSDLHRRFNEIWYSIKDKIRNKFYLNDKLECINYVKKIHQFFTTMKEVSMYNIPRTITVSNYQIYYFFNLIKDHQFNNKVYIFLDIKYLGNISSSSSLDIIGNLIEDDLKQVLENKLFSVVLIRIKDFVSLEYKPIKNSKLYINDYLNYVENNFVLPKNEYSTCSVCTKKTTCNWSVSK